MTATQDCVHEPRIVAAVLDGAWPHRADDDLIAHVTGCATCRDVAGIGVHIASRVMSEAQPSEILVSRTVRDLVGGSDIALTDSGTHRLKGIDGEWQLFAVTDGGGKR